MNFVERLNRIKSNYKEIEDKLSDPSITRELYTKYSKEYSDLGDVVTAINKFLGSKSELENLYIMEKSEEDADMRSMIKNEIEDLEKKITEYENTVKIILLPRDTDDSKSAILEIRAGTGGEEAALFAAVLFRMYQKYAEINNWKFEIISISETGIGGFKEAIASISGCNVFAKMKFESGAHRVQRIPETESSGRIHTSAATVAVLPEAEEVDIEIKQEDLRIDIYRSSGPGGQSVNTTDSAVRIVHIPTGTIVIQQDEKSQHKNKAKALKILRARLYDVERQKINNERAQSRKEQVGSGDRSERIRTYNFPQGRVSDHRINYTSYRIGEIVNNGELDEMINLLIAENEARKLSEEI